MYDWTKTMHDYTILGMNGTLVICVFFSILIALIAKSWALACLPLAIILYNLFAKKILKLEIRHTPRLFKSMIAGNTRLPSRSKSYLHQDPLE